MVIALLISSALLWLAVLFVAFVLLGTLRAMEVLRWRMDQLEATMPSRMGRSGLKPGKKAPVFKLPSVVGPEMGLGDFAGRKVLVVFVQSGCGPCGAIAPDLNRVHREGKVQVLVVNNADREAGLKWASESEAEFPVLLQDKWTISKRYEVMATPFAFLVDEKGIVVSRGTVGTKQHLRFVLEGRRDGSKVVHAEGEGPPENSASNGQIPVSHTKEVEHV